MIILNSEITPAQQNLTVFTGDTFNDVFTYYDVNCNPVNLTGYTALMQARYNLTDASPFLNLSTSNGGLTLGGTAGTITVNISSATTSSLTPGVGLYDLQISGSGVTSTIVQGSLQVMQMVTT